MKLELPECYDLDLLKASAVSAMSGARPRRSMLPVGCALYDTRKNIFTGANVEVLWQRSAHAEEVAVLYAMSHDAGKIRALCIAAERDLFTPCGHCMDLIREFAHEDAIVIHINPKTKKTSTFGIQELMPFYPTRK